MGEDVSPPDRHRGGDVAMMSADDPQMKQAKYLLLSLLMVSYAAQNILLGSSIIPPDGRYVERDLSQYNHSELATSPDNHGSNDWSYLQCAFNKPYPRPNHTCTTNSALHISYCHMEAVSILVDEVKVSMGNESVTSVSGRRDEEEFPIYATSSTFSVPRPIQFDRDFERGEDHIFYLENVLEATAVHQDASPSQCTLNISGPVLLITRYEYCNLYHTMTDWFNAFFALPNPAAKATVLFLDGHAQGALDPVWSQVFGPTHFIKSFPRGTRLCLDDATFVPAGYASPLWRRGRHFPQHYPPCPEMMDAFVHRVLASYGVLETQMIPGRVTIVGRKPYMAHPRSNPKRTERTVSNLPELAAKFKDSHIVYFETMSIREQLQTIRETDVLIANHGAALSHLLFLHDGATVME